MDDEYVDSQLALKMDNEPNEVSYSVLNIEQYVGKIGKVNFPDDLLKMLSTAINVRLFMEGNHYFPNIPFDKFNTLLSEDKIFLFGPSGCGKSRAIYEMIKKNLKDFDKIYLINPRNSLGKESGRMPLKDLVTRVNENDAIVWDNFPDDLMRRDVANARRVLEILGSCAAKKVLVALKPKYMEVYREISTQIPEFFAHGIKYNKDQFKRIVEQYGTTIPQFKEAYTKYVLMNLEKIASILWNKEPTPLTIFDYYDKLRNKELTTSSTLSGVAEAETLLRSTSYYEHQFQLLRNSEERAADTEFLYVLKMCYELGLDRTENKISQLQQAIFKSAKPGEVYKKLSNWVYIYGQYYSMHDVCRDAVNLSDDVKMKIVSYISDNFSLFLTDNDDLNQINLLGLFIGKNIQFVLKNTMTTTVFLPDDIYNYMKRNAAFEKAIGQGVGEIFQSLEDDDRKRLLKKADIELEFGVGMAESLGHRFPFLDYEQRKPVLDKIYDGYLFARFFGQSLGRHIKDLPIDIKNQILDHTLINPQFADGLGIGLGQVFDSLDEELKKEVNERAKSNIGLTRGLGFGLTFNFLSLSESQRKEIYARTGMNFQLDMGLGLGLASQYTTLPKDLRDEIISRCKDHYAFGFGFGLYLGYVSADRCPDEVLSCMEKNGQLAYGLGYGFGIKFPYEPPEFQSSLISKSNESNQLDRGLGYGLGLIIRHLPKPLQSNFFKHADAKNEFDRGLGCGIGFSWVYQSPEDEEKSYARCKTNSSFAQGLGFGQGYHFKYLSREEMDSIFKNASNNSHYDNGVGYGLGWSFPYLSDVLRKEVLIRSRTNNLFAYGLGSGVGVILAYLPSQTQTETFQRAAEDGWFARGLGFGLGGYALQSYAKELQEEVLMRTNDDAEFAIGLGEGIGFAFKLFQDEFQRKIMDNNSILANPFFTRGLGIGFGKSFKYLSHDFKLDLYQRADENTHFAIGLGEGISSVFQYLDDDDFVRNDILAKAFLKEDGFARGLGTGFGSIFLYFTEEFRDELLLQRCAENRQFAIGLGKGLGLVFSYLPLELQISLFKQADENTHFAIGLGEGIGSIIFRYLDSSFQKDVLTKTEKDPSFAKGLGIGIGSFYKYYDSTKDLHNMIFASISSAPYMAEGFGTGIGMVYPYLSEKLHADLFQLAEQNMHFATAFGFSLGHAFYAPKSKNSNKSYNDNRLLPRNPEFEYGFGVGVGHNFPYLEAKIQEQVLNNAQKIKNFGSGFGTGLAKSFRHLDKILEQEILRQASGKKQGEVWYSLGYGLGSALPSISGQLQKQLLQIAKDYDNNLFIRGFAAGVDQSLKYLSKQSLDQLSRLAEEENSFFRIDKLGNNKYQDINANNSSSKIDFFYDYFVGVDQAASEISSTSDREGLQPWISGKEEVSFLGQRKKCCVCFIDLVGSTRTASQLDKMQLSKYYSIFLNAIATIIRNFEGRTIKNAGDALIYYFPSTTDSEDNPSNFQDVFECAFTMIAAHQAINAKMQEEGLPPVNYRISAEYGMVEVAKSQSSQSEDLFGSTMNICAKINGKAMPNGMVIGEDIFKMVQQSLADQYTFKHTGEIALDLVNRSEYSVYQVEPKEARNILNPFKYKKQV